MSYSLTDYDKEKAERFLSYFNARLRHESKTPLPPNGSGEFTRYGYEGVVDGRPRFLGSLDTGIAGSVGRAAAAFYLGILLIGCDGSEQVVEPEIAYLSQADAITQTRLALEQELDSNGGWPIWVEATSAFRQDLRKYRQADSSRTPRNKLFEGGDGIWINPVEILGRDTPLTLIQKTHPEIEHSSAVVDSITRFNAFLNERNIDLIFVPVPSRLEMYPELYSLEAPEGLYPEPYTRAIMLELLEANIEVLDVFDLIRDAKETAGDQLLYFRHDNHFRSVAQNLVAEEIGKRLMRYASVRDEFSERLPFQKRELDGPKVLEYNISRNNPDAYAACPECTYTQILDPRGNPSQSVQSSPLIISGDSFLVVPLTGVNEELTAGLSLYAHITHAIRMNTTMIAEFGGGPKVPRMVVTSRKYSLENREVIVWIMNSHYVKPVFDNLWRQGMWPQVN